MKSNAMPDGFPVSREDWDKLIAEAPEHIDDPECPYDPNDPASVEEYWKDAVEVDGGGPEAVRAALDERRRTRGVQKVPTKVSTTIRLSPEVLAYFKAGGKGWQTRIDAALKAWIAQRER